MHTFSQPKLQLQFNILLKDTSWSAVYPDSRFYTNNIQQDFCSASITLSVLEN